MNQIEKQNVKEVVKLLQYTFVVLPITAGADKFVNVLTDWKQYMSPMLLDLIPFSPAVFMMIVGGIEIVAGLIVLKNAYLGGYIVAAWLGCISLSLLFSVHYVDVAVRDLVMALAAWSMARLSKYA